MCEKLKMAGVEIKTLPDHRQSKLDERKVREAVAALLAFHKKRSQELNKELFLNEAGVIQLQLAVWRITGKKAKTIRIDLPHSTRVKSSEACLFTKDVEGKSKEECVEYFNQLLQEKGVEGVGEVIPLKVYRKEYKEFIARRQLVQKYEIFLADDRIIRLMHTHLGKEFYKRKKYPVNVSLTKKDLKKEIEGAINASYFNLSNRGDCNHFVVGRTDMTIDQITENIIAGAQSMVERITKGWPNVKALYVKTRKSVSLPLYTSLVFEDWTKDITVDNSDIVKLKKLVEAPETPSDDEEQTPETPTKDVKQTPSGKKTRPRQGQVPVKKEVLSKKAATSENQEQPSPAKEAKSKRRRLSGKQVKKLKLKMKLEGEAKATVSVESTPQLKKGSGRTLKKEVIEEKSKLGVKSKMAVKAAMVAKVSSKSKKDSKSKKGVAKSKTAAKSKIDPSMAAKYKMDAKTMAAKVSKITTKVEGEKKVVSKVKQTKSPVGDKRQALRKRATKAPGPVKKRTSRAAKV